MVTPPNFRVCARRKVPAKRFTICHILYTYTKTQSCFFRFSFPASTLFFPIECPGLCQHKTCWNVSLSTYLEIGRSACNLRRLERQMNGTVLWLSIVQKFSSILANIFAKRIRSLNIIKVIWAIFARDFWVTLLVWGVQKNSHCAAKWQLFLRFLFKSGKYLT